jgi:hypothetical protein
LKEISEPEAYNSFRKYIIRLHLGSEIQSQHGADQQGARMGGRSSLSLTINDATALDEENGCTTTSSNRLLSFIVSNKKTEFIYTN